MAGLGIVFRFGYHEDRVTTYVNTILAILRGDVLAVPNDQVRQGLIALGSGGVMGTGVGRGLQKFNFLPQPHTDFILAIHGEETGFVGVVLLLAIEIFVVWRILRIGLGTRDAFGRLLCLGVGTQIGILVLTHAAVNLGVGPTTGVPLPFVSYGGSALVANLAAVGLVLAVSRQGAELPRRKPLDRGPSRWRTA
jgi:cell division protein FtsW